MKRLFFATPEYSVDLSIAGYQFPDSNDSANWLFVDLEARLGDEVFRKRDPSLETHELVTLAVMLREGAQHADTFRAWCGPRLTSHLFFTEPNLEVEIRGDRGELELRIYFALESLPSFASKLPHVARVDDEGKNGGPSQAWMDFPITEAQLLEAAEVVESWLATFPTRPEVDD